MTPLRIAFFVLTLLVLGATHLYLYRRLVRDVTTRRTIRRAAQALLIVLAAGAVVTRLVARTLPERPIQVVAAVLLGWLGVSVYLLLAVLTADFFRWMSRRWWSGSDALASPERRHLLARAVAIGSSAAAAGVGSYGAWRAFRPPEVTEVPVPIPGLPPALSGFTLVQLTDLHIGPILQTRFVEELSRRVNALRPDLVAITGDLVDGSVSHLGRHVAVLRGLTSRYGTFFVTGNHDYYSGDEAWCAALEGMGITVLRNRHVAVGDRGASFDLIGVDDWSAARFGRGYDLERALHGRDPGRPAVLLAHQPSNFDVAAQRGVHLQLSGHTHGGQMFPATGIARLIWGERAAGLSRMGSAHLYVSRGCGFVGPPMRVGSPPEIVKLVLLPG